MCPCKLQPHKAVCRRSSKSVCIKLSFCYTYLLFIFACQLLFQIINFVSQMPSSDLSCAALTAEGLRSSQGYWIYQKFLQQEDAHLTCVDKDSQGIWVLLTAEESLRKCSVAALQIFLSTTFIFCFFSLLPFQDVHIETHRICMGKLSFVIIFYYCTIIYFGKFVSLFKVPESN